METKDRIDGGDEGGQPQHPTRREPSSTRASSRQTNATTATPRFKDQVNDATLVVDGEELKPAGHDVRSSATARSARAVPVLGAGPSFKDQVNSVSLQEEGANCPAVMMQNSPSAGRRTLESTSGRQSSERARAVVAIGGGTLPQFKDQTRPVPPERLVTLTRNTESSSSQNKKVSAFNRGSEPTAPTLQSSSSSPKPQETTQEGGTQLVSAELVQTPISAIVEASPASSPRRYKMLMVLLVVGAAVTGAVVGLCGSGSCSGNGGDEQSLTNSSSDASKVSLPEVSTTPKPSPTMTSFPSPVAQPASLPTSKVPISSSLVPTMSIPTPVAPQTRSPVVTPRTTPKPISSQMVLPVSEPTRSPTEVLTPNPTLESMLRPTRSPTLEPTERPITTPVVSRSEMISKYINSISLLSGDVVYESSSAEGQALTWLINDDPLQLSIDSAADRFRLGQRYALATMWFQSTTPWTKQDNWLQGDECAWYGITCKVESSQNVVTKIDTTVNFLSGNNVNGQLSNDLGLLSYLSTLDVSSNRISGPLPSSFGYLTGLTAFDVSNNELTGTLPESLGQLSRLISFAVELNQFSGTIPGSIVSWSELDRAWFYSNLFTGSLPLCETAASFTQLEVDCSEVACACCTNCS